MNIGSLTGEITLVDQMTKVLEKLDSVLQVADRSARQTSEGIDHLEKRMTLAATAGSFMGNVLANAFQRVVSFTTNLVTSSLMAGARLEQLGVATRYMGEAAGYTSQFIDELSKKIEATGISGIASREAIQQLLGANIDLANAAKLSAIAQNMQSLSGRSSSEVFQVMTRAIATGNTEILRNIGFQNLSIDALSRAQRATTGATGAITGAARTQMILNAILKEGASFTGLYAESMTTAGKQASSSERAWAQVAEQIGTVLLPITTVAIKSWYDLGQSVRDGVTEGRGAVDGFVDAAAKGLQTVIDKSKELLLTGVDVGTKLYDAYYKIPDVFRGIGAAAVVAAAGVWALNASITTLLGLSVVKWVVGISTALLNWTIWIQGAGWVGRLSVALGVFKVAVVGIAGSVGGITTLLLSLGTAIWEVAKAIEALDNHWRAGGGFWEFFTKSDPDNFIRRWIPGLASLADTITGLVTDLPEIKPPAALFPEVRPWDDAFQKASFGGWDMKTPVAPEIDAGTKAAQEYAKKVSELVVSLSEGDKGLRLFRDAFVRLKPEVLASYDAQQRLAPEIMKLVAANQTLTPAMEQVLQQYQNSRTALLEKDLALLATSNITLKYIDTLKLAGYSEAEIALKLGVTTEALSKHATMLEFVKSTNDRLLKSNAPTWADFTKKIEETTSRVAKIIIQNALLIKSETDSLSRTMRQRTMSDTDFQIDEIRRLAAFRKSQLTGPGALEAQVAIDLSTADAVKQLNIDALNYQIEQYNIIIDDMAGKTKALNQATTDAAFEGLANFFNSISLIAGDGGIGKFLSAAGQMVVALKLANDISSQTGRRFGALSVMFDKSASSSVRLAAGMQAAASIAQGAVNVWRATETSRTRGGNAMGGMMAGAQAGAAFGPYGIAIGAAAGLVVGLIRGKPAWAKAAEEVGRDFGTKIGDELAKTIASQAKDLFRGSRQAAGIFNLDQIIGEAGGLNAKNLTQMTARYRDTFSMLEKGVFSVDQVTEVLDKNWASFVEAHTDGTGAISNNLKEIIKLNERFGTQSKEIAKWQQGQAVWALESFNAMAAAIPTSGNAAKAIAQMGEEERKALEEGAKGYKGSLEEFLREQAELYRTVEEGDPRLKTWLSAGTMDIMGSVSSFSSAATRAIAQMGAEERSALEEGARGYKGTLEEFLGEQAALYRTAAEGDPRLKTWLSAGTMDIMDNAFEAQAALAGAKQELQDLGVIATGSFAAALATGLSFAQALATIQPGLKDLRVAYADLGLEIEDPFLKLLTIQSEVLDKQPKLLQAVDGLSGSLTSMNNLGVLNADMFASVGRLAEVAYGRLQAAVVEAGGSTKDALLPMQGYLRAAQKAAEDLGIPVDDFTQSLIDQSVDLGLWKDAGKSAMDTLISSMTTLTEKMEDFVNILLGIPPVIRTGIEVDYRTGSPSSGAPQHPGAPERNETFNFQVQVDGSAIADVVIERVGDRFTFAGGPL